MLAALPEDVTPDTSSLRFAICGAAPASAELLNRFETRYGFPLIEGYGLSEGTCASTINPIDGPRRAGTVGKPFPGQRIRIVDANGDDVPTGSDGEIIIAGPNVMRGYLGRPEATADEVALARMDQGLVITLHLNPEDSRAREFAGKRSDVDDVSTSAWKHPSQCEFGSRDHAEDVDLDDASGHGVVLVDDPSDRHDARIVDQHVDRAEFTFDGVEEVEERGGVGDVEAPERADAQILGCSRESGFVDVADRDRRTQADQPLRGGVSDAPGAAGDDHYLTVERFVHLLQRLQR